MTTTTEAIAASHDPQPDYMLLSGIRAITGGTGTVLIQSYSGADDAWITHEEIDMRDVSDSRADALVQDKLIELLRPF